MHEKSEVFVYADDTAIVVTDSSFEKAKKQLQEELNIIIRWSHDLGLIINPKKIKTMHIKPPQKTHENFSRKFHNFDCLHKVLDREFDNNDECSYWIETVSEIKYLGVIVGCTFSVRTCFLPAEKIKKNELYRETFELQIKSKSIVPSLSRIS